MFEIKILGRGGLGVVSTAKIIGLIAINMGLNATSIPRFGAERRGAPVSADVRISKTLIKTKSFIEKGDMNIVLDDTAFSPIEIISHTKNMGLLLLNSTSIKNYEKFVNNYNIMLVDATGAALNKFNKLLPNIIILGAFCKIFEIKNEKIIINSISDIIPTLEKEKIWAMLDEGAKQIANNTKIDLNQRFSLSFSN